MIGSLQSAIKTRLTSALPSGTTVVTAAGLDLMQDLSLIAPGVVLTHGGYRMGDASSDRGCWLMEFRVLASVIVAAHDYTALDAIVLKLLPALNGWEPEGPFKPMELVDIQNSETQITSGYAVTPWLFALRRVLAAVA